MSDITDDDIQAEIKAKLKEAGISDEHEAPSVAAQAPKSRAKPPAHIEDIKDTEGASNLSVLESHLKKAPPSPDAKPEGDTSFADVQKNVLSKLGSLRGSDLQAMGAGAATGYVLPKVVEGISPGRTISPENELLYRQNLQGLQHAQETNPFAEYETKSKNLLTQHSMAQNMFAESQRQLKDALGHHALTQTLTLNDFLPPEFRTTPSAPESVLSRQPIGGEATSNYAQKFGLTPLESMEAPSMSKVQQKIPSVADAITRAQQTGPGFGKFEESSLLLGPEGQKYAMEQKREQQLQEQHRKALEEDAKRKLAEHKAQAQINLENAQKAHELNMKALRDVEKSMQTHITPGVPPTVSPEEQRLRAETEKYGGAGKTARVLSYMGRKIAPRFSPILAGAVAPEQALAAKKAYEEGDIPRAAAYGLGSLGSVGMMTGIPLASGLGMVANLPSLYYEGEDLMKPSESKKP